jgi:release factor glutamine methyltransferase
VSAPPYSEPLRAALQRGTARLAEAGVESPAREARLLAAHLLGLGQGALLDPATAIDRAEFDALVERRAAREPMALIVGRQGFWTLDLAVSKATLIPRADSETLIEAALAAFPDRRDVRDILDLGTGTGCLLLAALSEFPLAWGLGVDLSESAVRLAAANAVHNGLATRACFISGEWAAAIDHRFDLILANPPYIEAESIAGLMPEVAMYEPRSALDGGVDGLDAYRAIMPSLPHLLRPGGTAVLEIGWKQDVAVMAIAEAAGFRTSALRMDLSGHARAVVLQGTAAQKSFGTMGEDR